MSAFEADCFVSEQREACLAISFSLYFIKQSGHWTSVGSATSWCGYMLRLQSGENVFKFLAVDIGCG